MQNVIEEIIKYAQIAGEKGFTPGISGNISARLNNDFVITASGSANGYLKEEDFIKISSSGEKILGDKKPSSERFLHLKFYEKRPDINCIFHVHSPYLTSFAASSKALDEGISPEIIYCFGQIPLAKYALPGSDDLVKNTSIYFENHDVILMENHGVIVGGKDVQQAYLNLELAEYYAKTLICAKILGGAKILSDDEVQKIYLLRQK